jgi:hypothetical protein
VLKLAFNVRNAGVIDLKPDLPLQNGSPASLSVTTLRSHWEPQTSGVKPIFLIRGFSLKQMPQPSRHISNLRSCPHRLEVIPLPASYGTRSDGLLRKPSAGSQNVGQACRTLGMADQNQCSEIVDGRRSEPPYTEFPCQTAGGSPQARHAR